MLLMEQGSCLRWVNGKIIKFISERDVIFKRWIMNEFSFLENLLTVKINLECFSR